jgi:phytoene synthase
LISAKQLIEADIQNDFDEAYIGIMNLPKGARMGVYLAYIYYQTLFNKIKQLSATRIQSERVRVPNPQKFALLAQTYVKYRLNVL